MKMIKNYCESYFTDSGWFFVIDDTKKGDSFDCHADDVTVSTDQS